MKNALYLLFVLLMILCLCGCAINDHQSNAEVSFYYLKNDVDYGDNSPLIIEITRQIPGQSLDYPTIITEYLNGTSTNDYRSPFPEDMRLISMDISDTKVFISLTKPAQGVSATRNTIAFACITKTVTALTDIDNVQITLVDEQTESEDIYKFTNESFALSDPITIHDLED